MAGAAAQVALYDNGPLITHPGAGFEGADVSVQQDDLGLRDLAFGAQKADEIDNRVADDFEVSAPSGWQLDSVELHAYQTYSGLESTIEEVNFRIWAGVPGEEGSTVIYGDGVSNSLLTSSFSGIYRTSDSWLTNRDRPLMVNEIDLSEVYLPPGTYWLDIQLSGSSANGPWVPPVTILGEDTTGNGVQFRSDPEHPEAWIPLQDGGAGTQQGMPFALHGSEARLRLAQEDIPVPEVSSGDVDVPVLAFSAATLVRPGVELTSLDVATVGPDGATPLSDSPVNRVKLFLDADLDGVPDAPGTPVATAVVAADGTATLDLSGITIGADTPVGFVLAYDLKDSLASVALPLTVAGLALLLPGFWLARRRRKASPLLALGLIVALVSACDTTAPSEVEPTVIEFQARVTSATSEVASGPFVGSSINVDVSGVAGETITVSY